MGSHFYPYVLEKDFSSKLKLIKLGIIASNLHVYFRDIKSKVPGKCMLLIYQSPVHNKILKDDEMTLYLPLPVAITLHFNTIDSLLSGPLENVVKLEQKEKKSAYECYTFHSFSQL